MKRLVLLLFVLAPAAPADAATLRVSAPVTVAEQGTGPVTAALDDGTTVVAWTGLAGTPARGVFARHGAGVQAVAADNAFGVELAANPRGDRALAWVHDPGGAASIRAAVAPAGEPFGAPVTVAAAGPQGNGADQVTRPRVAVAADGTVIVGYQHYRGGTDQRALVAVRPPGAEFGEPQTLWPTVVNGPDLAAAGDAVLAMWSAAEGQARRIMVAERPPGGAFGAPARLSSAARDADNNSSPPTLAANRRGDAMVVWNPMDISTDGGPRFGGDAWGAYRPAGGAWSPEFLLPQQGTRPSLAVGPAGDALVASTLGGGISAAYAAGGPFRLDRRWWTDAGAVVQSPLALTAAGDAVLLRWVAPPSDAPRISALVRPRGACFADEQDVSARGVATGRPVLSLRADGTGSAAWEAGSAIHTVELRVDPGGRVDCTDSAPPMPNLPEARFTLARTPARVSARTLRRRGIALRLRAAAGFRFAASLARPGRRPRQLAEARRTLTRPGAFTLKLRPRTALRRGTRLELWVTATGIGVRPKTVVRRLRVR